MAILDDLTTTVDDIAKARWETTDGRVVPESDDIGLGNKGIYLDATLLYADLEDSTELVSHNTVIAAEIYKAFLACCSRLVLNRGGAIRSFDGDRVMGVFIGDSKNTSAVRAALNIKYVFNEVLVPRFKRQYDIFKEDKLKLNYCVGIDTGKVLVARAGVRNNNDLVWAGQAPNIAAKLSTIRQPPHTTCITKTVYDNMNDEVKVTGDKNMWESRSWSALPSGHQDLYRSSWHWKP